MFMYWVTVYFPKTFFVFRQSFDSLTYTHFPFIIVSIKEKRNVFVLFRLQIPFLVPRGCHLVLERLRVR